MPGALVLSLNLQCEASEPQFQSPEVGAKAFDLFRSQSPDRERWPAEPSMSSSRHVESQPRSPSADASCSAPGARGAESAPTGAESDGLSWAPGLRDPAAGRKRRARPQRAAGDNAAAWWLRFLELVCFRQALPAPSHDPQGTT